MCLLAACKPIPDPIVQEFGGRSLLLLPDSFESWRRVEALSPSSNALAFAEAAYQSDALIPFEYGPDGIAGFAITFETDFEAQRRHEAAVRSLPGTLRVSDRESETVSGYDGRYFFETEDPNLMFHIGNHVVFMTAATTGISRTSSLRRALAFAERVFELNDRLGTRPLRPFQLDPLRFAPSNAAPIQPAQTRFELDLAYIVEDQPAAHISARVWWFKAGRGSVIHADSVRVSRGTGEVSFTWDVDLTDGAFSDILSVRAHISYPDGEGGVTIPTTSLIDPIRYDIARTNN